MHLVKFLTKTTVTTLYVIGFALGVMAQLLPDSTLSLPAILLGLLCVSIAFYEEWKQGKDKRMLRRQRKTLLRQLITSVPEGEHIYVNTEMNARLCIQRKSSMPFTHECNMLLITIDNDEIQVDGNRFMKIDQYMIATLLHGVAKVTDGAFINWDEYGKPNIQYPNGGIATFTSAFKARDKADVLFADLDDLQQMISLMSNLHEFKKLEPAAEG